MDIRCALTLLQLPQIGRKRYLEIITYIEKMNINTNRNAFSSVFERLGLISRWSQEQIKMAEEAADDIINNCKKDGIKILYYKDADYPLELRQIDDFPIVLFFKGNERLLSESNKKIAVIGTRTPKEKSKYVAREVARFIAENDGVVVSGLAKGCDTYAHFGSLDVNGKTIAVLPSPIDKIYPYENTKLAHNILEKEGGLISEYSPISKLNKGNFIERDRIQAALSKKVFLVESKINDGSMHTIKFAQKYGKEIICYFPADKDDSFKGNLYVIENLNAKYIKDINDFKILL